MATGSSTLAWKIPWTEEPGGLQSMGSGRFGYDWATSLSGIGEGNGNPLQCSCLENPRDGGAWWAAIYGVAQSQTRLKQLSSSSSNQELKGEREMIGTEVIRNCVWRNGIKQAWNVGQPRDEPGKYPFHSKYSGMYLFCLTGKLRPVQFSSVTQSRRTVCDPVNCSMPGLPVCQQLPESTQTHVPWVGDAVQPSHPLSSPNPSALNLSQQQGLFKWVSSLHQVAKVLEFQLQHQSEFPEKSGKGEYKL